MTFRRDLGAGLVCAAAGLATAAEASRYPTGTLREIGPGFQPMVLGVLLCLVGLLIAANAFADTEAVEELLPGELPEQAEAGMEWRGWLCIIASVVVFIVAARPAGLALTAFASVLVAALGDRGTTWRGAVILAACVAAFGTVLFGELLGVNLPLWPAL